MKYMSWSWRDYCELPALYHGVLVEMIDEEHRRIEHEQAMAKVRRR
mgnify:CR=1 FL=1|tara:strand:- start:20222 stop:20359 length:138 start_codon:yes stop_codon:yes gene_type:complete